VSLSIYTSRSLIRLALRKREREKEKERGEDRDARRGTRDSATWKSKVDREMPRRNQEEPSGQSISRSVPLGL